MAIEPKDLPAWVRGQMDLRSNVAQWPIARFDVHKFGGYGVTRSKPGEGACGPRAGEPTWIDNPQDTEQEQEAQRIKAQRFPCKHWGVDLSAPKGTKVVAPKDGWVLYHGPANDAPFRGYGPWVILIAHRDAGDTMWQRGWKWATGPLVDILDFPEGLVSASYSLIGHLAPTPGVSPRIALPGDFWSSIGGQEDHWKKLKYGGRGMMTDADAHDDNTRRVFAGETIGHVSDANHIHWEIRNAPVADKGPPTLTTSGRFDPIQYFQANYGLQLPEGVTIAKPAVGGGGVLLLLAALAFGRKKKQGARARR